MDRTKGIGGSDIAALYNLKPYGCIYELYLTKIGTEPDFPICGMDIDRGTKMESLVCAEFSERTGLKIEIFKEPILVDGHPWARANVDGFILDGERKRLEVIEVKVPRQWNFDIMKKKGVFGAHQLQCQFYMWASGVHQCRFVGFWADGWEMIQESVRYKPVGVAAITKKARDFWNNNVIPRVPPPKLEMWDDRCQGCQFRVVCRKGELIDFGVSLKKTRGELLPFDDSFDGLISEYRKRKEIEDVATKAVGDMKEQIKEKVGDRHGVVAGNGRVTYKPQISNRWDTKQLGKDHSELEEKYKRPSYSRPLKIT